MATEIKLPDDPKLRKLLAIAAVAVVGVGAYWYFLWKPDHAEVVTIAAHADTLETDNELVKAAVKSGEMQRIIDASAQYSAELGVLRRLVPTSTEVPALIDGVSTVARLNGMDISTYEPLGEMPGDYFDARKYKFSVTGPYHRVAEFFTAIGSLDRILVPMNVLIAPSGRKTERRPQKDETFVDVTFELMTYVSKTTLPPAVPAR
jgi:type IV pilus assembly protein PilO